jgi:hypothetical protein
MRWCSLVAALVLASPALADTDPAAATASVKEAEALAKAQKYDEAATKFRAAHRLDPRPEYLCNVGVAYQRAKQWPKAQIYLGECLLRGQTLDGKFIALVRTALGSVEDKLRAGSFTPIELILEPRASTIALDGFDADETFVGSRVIWVPFGKHTITASAEGYAAETREIDAQSRSQRQVNFALKKLVIDVGAAPAVVPGSSTVLPPREQRRSKVPAIVSTTVTVALGAGALVTFFKARSTMDGASSTMIDKPRYDEIVDDARRWQHISWGLGAAAGVGAIVSGYLWYRGTRTSTLEVTPTTSGGAVTLSGTW